MNQASVVVFNLGSSVSLILPANPNRVGLVLSSVQSDSWTLGNDPKMLTGQGIRMPAGGPPFMLLAKDVGTWIQGDLFAIAGGFNANVAILEIICPCQQRPPSP